MGQIGSLIKNPSKYAFLKLTARTENQIPEKMSIIRESDVSYPHRPHDLVTRFQFIEEARSPLPGIALNTPRCDMIIMEEQQRQSRLQRQPQGQPRHVNKKSHKRTKMELINPFRQNGYDKEAEWYSQRVKG